MISHNEIYLDNSATTKVLDSVKEIVVKTMTEDYGNPSARHRKGKEAEDYCQRGGRHHCKDPEGSAQRDPLYFRRN